MQQLSYRRHRFPPLIIQHATWLYLRFTLSYRDVEEPLVERGIDVSNETIRRWVLKFGRLYAQRLRRSRPKPDDRWHLDEMFVSIRGKRMYLWRAVDSEGEVLDFLIQSKRNKAAALKLMRKLLKNQGFAPRVVVTLLGFAGKNGPPGKKPGSSGDPGSTKWLFAGARCHLYRTWAKR